MINLLLSIISYLFSQNNSDSRQTQLPNTMIVLCNFTHTSSYTVNKFGVGCHKTAEVSVDNK